MLRVHSTGTSERCLHQLSLWVKHTIYNSDHHCTIPNAQYNTKCTITLVQFNTNTRSVECGDTEKKGMTYNFFAGLDQILWNDSSSSAPKCARLIFIEANFCGVFSRPLLMHVLPLLFKALCWQVLFRRRLYPIFFCWGVVIERLQAGSIQIFLKHFFKDSLCHKIHLSESIR